MGLFGGFKAKFTKDKTVKSANKRNNEVVCLGYREYSEFKDPENYSQPTTSNNNTITSNIKPLSKLKITSKSTESIIINGANNSTTKNIEKNVSPEKPAIKKRALANSNNKNTTATSKNTVDSSKLSSTNTSTQLANKTTPKSTPKSILKSKSSAPIPPSTQTTNLLQDIKINEMMDKELLNQQKDIKTAENPQNKIQMPVNNASFNNYNKAQQDIGMTSSFAVNLFFEDDDDNNENPKKQIITSADC